MQYQVDVDGFEGHQLAIRPGGWVAGPQLLLDGLPARKGPKRNQYSLQTNDGKAVVARMRPMLLNFDPVPQLEIDGRLIVVVEPLKWYQVLWSALPFLLIIVGGVLGAVAGAIAWSINTRLFRSSLPPVVRYAATAAISLLAAILYLVAALLLRQALN